MSRLASTAVMARRAEPATSLDFFPTPPWATRALCAHVLPLVEPQPLSGMTAWDPACGEGHMAVALAESFWHCYPSDVFPYGFGEEADFLSDGFLPTADWIVTNPPFNRALPFTLRALRLARRGVAMLVRTAFLEGDERYRHLFSRTPPTVYAQFVERVPMHRGRWVPDGSSATSYCWLVWRRGAEPRPPFWIPKSRKALTRPDDAIRFNAAAPVPLLEERSDG